jgi:hypothetical protein
VAVGHAGAQMAETLASFCRQRPDLRVRRPVGRGECGSGAAGGGGGHPVGYLRGQALLVALGFDRFLVVKLPGFSGWVAAWGCGWWFVDLWIVDARASFVLCDGSAPVVGSGVLLGRVVVRMCRVLIFGQVVKGGRWMPWHQEPMKDVGGRDRPGGAVNRAVIPGCPNGGTQLESCPVTCI